MRARVTVTLKNGVLDPQGQAIQGSLKALGFAGIGGVRQGKVFDIELAETDSARAEQSLKAMCEKLLANTVIENYAIEFPAEKRPVAATEPPKAPDPVVAPPPPPEPAIVLAPGEVIPIDARIRRSVAPPDGADLT